MGDRSKIEWTDASWTPIRTRNRATGKVGWHCENASPGCEHCYSETLNIRLGTGLPFKPGHRADVEVFLDEKMLLQPLRWARPRMIFVCSMTDLFADFVADAMIDRVFAVMALCPQHTMQVLTKRSARMRAYCSDPRTPRRVYEVACDIAIEQRLTTVVLIAPGYPDDAPPPGPRVYLETWPLPNVWKGVSAEDQRRADERVPDLLATPAALRFVSAEPVLGPIDFRNLPPVESYADKPLLRLDTLTGKHQCGPAIFGDDDMPRVDQVIVGGESGRGARPMHPQWARDIRDQCAAAGVPFFFKQWGAWAPYRPEPGGDLGGDVRTGRVAIVHTSGRSGVEISEATNGRSTEPGSRYMRLCSKKAAGRLLDGVEHNGMPHNAAAPLAGAA